MFSKKFFWASRWFARLWGSKWCQVEALYLRKWWKNWQNCCFCKESEKSFPQNFPQKLKGSRQSISSSWKVFQEDGLFKGSNIFFPWFWKSFKLRSFKKFFLIISKYHVWPIKRKLSSSWVYQEARSQVNTFKFLRYLTKKVDILSLVSQYWLFKLKLDWLGMNKVF